MNGKKNAGCSRFFFFVLNQVNWRYCGTKMRIIYLMAPEINLDIKFQEKK